MTRRRSGFTLIELLVSGVLLAFVTAGVAFVLSTCLNAWRAGQEHDDFSQQASAIIDTISQDLRSSFLGRNGFFVAGEEGPEVYSLDCNTLSRRMQRFLYLSEHQEEGDRNLSDLSQVSYFGATTGEDGRFALYRQEICPPLNEPLADEDRDMENAQLLSDKVAAFRLRCCDGQDWLEEWDTTTAGGAASLPAAVEVSLTLVEGERERTYMARVPLFMSEVAAEAAQ